ncbi:MAG: carboxymuconolactone decarboxylase family protein [Planctomycetota bacterium]|nr:carboxymuconolactone decarboxylase family protein [Planctomycetota bacterium]
MSWIRVVEPDAATGTLKKEYDAAIKRAGRVFKIIKLFSLNPSALRGTMSLYSTLMHGRSVLSRAQREMIAVVVSQYNGCHY